MGLFKHLVQGDGDSAEATKRFYEEYRSVCDMTSEFYLQTIETVFQRHALPKGEYLHRGKRVDPGAITDIGLLAIEGERDDISGPGPDARGADAGDQSARREEAVSDGRGGRPLRHLQRVEVAQPHRAGMRGLS